MKTRTDSPETRRRALAAPCRLALVSLLAATAAAHAAGTIDITAPDTFSPGGNAVRVEAGIVDGAGVQEARLYFRGDLDDDFVFSAMRSDGERFIGRIPAPDAAVRTIEYQLLVVNGANETYTSQVLAMTAGEAARGEWQEVASTEEAEISAEYLEATAPKSFPASAGRFDIADTARWYGRVARIYRTAQLAGSPTGSAALAKDAGTILATRTAPAASSTTAESGSSGGDASTANVSSGGMNWGTIALGALGAVGAAAALGGGGDDGESGGGSVTPTTGSYQFGGSISGVAADGRLVDQRNVPWWFLSRHRGLCYAGQHPEPFVHPSWNGVLWTWRLLSPRSALLRSQSRHHPGLRWKPDHSRELLPVSAIGHQNWQLIHADGRAER